MLHSENPLSVFNYYKHNKKKFVSIYATCMVGVFVLYFMQVILSSSMINVNKGSLDILKNFSAVTCRTYLLTEDRVKKLQSLHSVETGYPCNTISTFYRSSAGFTTGVYIFEMYPDDAKSIMKKLNMNITQGRMFSNYGNEIIMSEQLAKNKGLKVGDSFGSMENPTETITASKKVVGLFDGKYLAAFQSIRDETLSNPERPAYAYGCMIFPKNNDISALNKDLMKFNETVTPSNSYNYLTYHDSYNGLSSFYSTYGTTFYILYFFIIVLICIGLSFLSYIYYSGRMTEFATLNAIGFTKQQLIKKSFIEITLINVLAYITGVILAVITTSILNIFHYKPLGQDLYVLSGESMIHAACCPIFVILFSIIPIWILFKKLDPIKIIEGEY